MKEFAACQSVLDELKQIAKQKPGAQFRFIVPHKAHNVSEIWIVQIQVCCISQISQFLNPPE